MDTELKDTFKDSLKKLPGVDAELLINSLSTPPGIGIRFNKRKNRLRDINELAKSVYLYATPVDWCDSGFLLPERPVFTLNPLLHAGVFYVQDPSSMIYEQITCVLRNSINSDSVNVLDFCAAPGGKTTGIINALKDNDILVANEFVPARGRILRENLQKWGFSNIITTGDNSASFANLNDIFDIIAVDAPCSGEGMMRKDDDARRQWSPQLIENCASLQKEILSDIMKTLKPGGYLIFSTCTFNISENEDNSRFIRDILGLEPIKIKNLDLKGIERVGGALYEDVEALRFMPHLTPDGEGLYVSVFQKPAECKTAQSEESESYSNSKLNSFNKKNRDFQNKKNQKSPTLTAGNIADLKLRFNDSDDLIFEMIDDNIYAVTQEVNALKQMLGNTGVHITSSGTPAGTLKGKDIIPDSRMVLSDRFNPNSFPIVEVGLDDALRFLRRESFALPPNISKGYIVINYEGYPLGIMKNIGNRANNLFPQSWKIHI